MRRASRRPTACYAHSSSWASPRRLRAVLRRPASWWVALRGRGGIGLGMAVPSGVLGPVLPPGREQGVTPDIWRPSHAAEYVVNGLVICIVAPVVEELAFRGLG